MYLCTTHLLLILCLFILYFYVIIILFLYLLLYFLQKAKYIKPGVYSDFGFVMVFLHVFPAS